MDGVSGGGSNASRSAGRSGGGDGTGGQPVCGAASGSPEEDVVLKFECQMYKVRDDEYLIDIQVILHIILRCVPWSAGAFGGTNEIRNGHRMGICFCFGFSVR